MKAGKSTFLNSKIYSNYLTNFIILKIYTNLNIYSLGLLKIPILHYDFYPATSTILYIGYHKNTEPKLVVLKPKPLS